MLQLTLGRTIHPLLQHLIPASSQVPGLGLTPGFTLTEMRILSPEEVYMGRGVRKRWEGPGRLRVTMRPASHTGQSLSLPNAYKPLKGHPTASDWHPDPLTCTEGFARTDSNPLLPGKLFAHHLALVSCNKRLVTPLTARVSVRPVSPSL